MPVKLLGEVEAAFLAQVDVDDRDVGDLIRHVLFPRMQNVRLPGTRVSVADRVAPVCAVPSW